MELKHLPIGEDVEHNQVAVNLTGGRGVLLNGNPGSGKSVCLSVLCCDVLKCSDTKLAILSPKILDFMNFESSALLVSSPDDYMNYLKYLHNESERRKEYCIQHHLKKIENNPEKPAIITVIDEYTVLKMSVKNFEDEVMKLVAETRYAAFSFVLCTQKVSGTNMKTELRDLIDGNRISFACSTAEVSKMVFGDLAEDAPAHLISAANRGVGYISTDSEKPKLFKGYYANDIDEINAAANTRNKRWTEAERNEIFN